MKTVLMAAAMFSLLSCKKDEINEDDTTLPVINITSPTSNQVFSSGQTVNIAGAVTDNDNLEEIHLEIINLTTGAFVSHEHFSPNAASYNLSKTFTTSASTSYKIKVEAHDASNNIARSEVTISSN